jgi:hypothetical protein
LYKIAKITERVVILSGGHRPEVEESAHHTSTAMRRSLGYAREDRGEQRIGMSFRGGQSPTWNLAVEEIATGGKAAFAMAK